MIDAVKMIADIPAELHIEVQDAAGEWHDAVLTASNYTPFPTEFGYPEFSGGESVFVAWPFEIPQQKRLQIRTRDGVESIRRVVGWTKTPNTLVMVEIEGVANA